MRPFFFGLLYYIFFFSTALSYAQKSEVRVQYFAFEEGLSSRIIYALHQDERGFLWIGTDYGLNRFDGQEFKVYTTEEHGFNDNRMVKVFGDQLGNLWVSSSSQLLLQPKERHAVDIFNPITEKNTSLLDWVQNPQLLAEKQVIDLFVDSQHNIYLITLSGGVYQCKNKVLIKVTQFPTKELIQDIQTNLDGTLWIVTSHGVYLMNKHREIKKMKSIQGESYDNFHLGESADFIDYSYGDSYKDLVGQAREVHRLYTNGDDSLLYEISAEYTCLFTNPAQLEAGVIHTKSKTFGMLDFHQNPKGDFTSWGIKVYGVYDALINFIDQQGGLWLYNPPHGIIRAQVSNTHFNRYLHQRSTPYHKTTATRGVFSVDSSLFTMSYKELYQLKLSSNKVVVQQNIKSLTDARLHSLLPQADKLLIGATQGQLINYNPATKQIENIYRYTKAIDSSFMYNKQHIIHWSLFKDKREQLWLGHEHGISYLDTTDNHLYPYLKIDDFQAIQEAFVYQFHENEQGIWVITSNGLYLLHPEKGLIARYYSEGSAEYRLPFHQLHHLHEDHEGYFWLATKGGGLIKWHPKTKEYKQFTTKNGLSHNVIYAVYPDEYNQLWLSSNRGIMRFHKETHFVTTYLIEDRITHEEFNRASHYQTTDGSIYFGGLDGLTGFHPQDFQMADNSIMYRPEITDFQVQDGVSGIWKNLRSSLIKTNQITLTPDDLGFSLKFASLDFKNSAKQQYAYFIEGFDKGWTHQKHNIIRINRLPYGRFKLLLKAQNSDGVWAEAVPITINIIKPIYLRTWFILFAIAGLILGVFALIKWRTHQLEMNKKNLQLEVSKRTIQIEKDKEVILYQKQELTKLDELKSRFFANISHEFRTPLTLILGPAKHSREMYDQLDAVAIKNSFSVIEEHGKNLLQLVEELLELSKLDANQIEVNLTPVGLPQLLERLHSNFQSQASYLGIQFNLENWPSEQSLSLDLNKIEKVINNLIFNALKFTSKDGYVLIRAYSNELDTLQIEVTDSGMGIHPEDLPHLFDRFYQSKQVNDSARGGTGIGLALAKELAEVMEGEITVKSELGKGSSFTLTLPLIMADSDAENEVVVPLYPVENLMPLQQELTTKNEKLETILIVEDNPSMQQFIVNLLKDDYQIIRANNGVEAQNLLLIKGQKIDLIVSDVMMPKMDGFSLFNWIKSTATWRLIPVIMLTARAAETDRLKALTIGVDDYLTKPFSAIELRARINNLLSHHRARKEWIAEKQVIKDKPGIPYLPDYESDSIMEGDLKWIAKVAESIKQQLTDSNFSIKNVAEEYQLSDRQFFRKLKKITGLSPIKYRQEIQLHTSRELLESGNFNNLAEISHAVGFHTPRYFARLFVDRFGKKPSDYLL